MADMETCSAQIFRRNFPNYSAGFSLNIPLRNRAAQSDYVTSQLEIRQNELNLQKSDESGSGRRAERGHRPAAGAGPLRRRRKARVLQQQTLDADQKKYELGATTVYQVVQDQRDLASAQSSEVQAMANYSHARIQFDLALGDTMDVNNITLSEALAGHVRRATILPPDLPAPEKQ